MEDIQNNSCTIENDVFGNSYRLVMSFTYSVLALVTTVLNVLILISIWKTPSLHKPSYILIGSLALSDVIVGALGEPLKVFHYIATLKRWPLNIYCLLSKCVRGVGYTMGAVSLLTLTFISLDRLLAVKLRNRYQSVVTKKRVLYTILVCWMISCVVSGIVFGKVRWNATHILPLFLFAGIGALCSVLTITVCYSMAFYSLRKITSSSVSPSVQNEEGVARPSPNIDVVKYRKSFITMFVVFIFTILFYMPLACTLIAYSIASYHQVSKTSLDIIFISIHSAELIAQLNSAVNPLLYLWRLRDIRETVKTIVKTLVKIF